MTERWRVQTKRKGFPILPFAARGSPVFFVARLAAPQVLRYREKESRRARVASVRP